MTHTTQYVLEADAVAYLTRCADEDGNHWSGGISWPADECPTCGGSNDAGWLYVPCSRYGRTSLDCAPVAWRAAEAFAEATGEPITADLLDSMMSAVVNDSDEIVELIGSEEWDQ